LESCDVFTHQYYQQKFGKVFPSPTSGHFKEPQQKVSSTFFSNLDVIIPPHNGIGSE
jgi:hypothetical protein